MHSLFAISILCLLSSVAACMAIGRRIQKGRAVNERSSYDQRDFAQHLIAAAQEDFLVPRSAPRQTVKDIAAKKSWNQRPELTSVRLKSSVSGLQRLDWAYFNKDMGDLNDPHGTPRAGVTPIFFPGLHQGATSAKGRFSMQSALPIESASLHAPASLRHDSIPGKALLIVGASLFVAACAHLSVPLPFTPVPITLQNFAVLVVGMMLGPVAGFSAMVLYLAEGAMGLPVFTPHSIGGVAHLLGPNAGYLFSYPLAAAVAGWVVSAMQRVTTRFRSALVASIAASLPIFAMGAGWLGRLLHLSVAATWTLAIAPFLLGEVVKITAAAGLFSTLQRWRRS